jgi:hypothetical protein
MEALKARVEERAQDICGMIAFFHSIVRFAQYSDSIDDDGVEFPGRTEAEIASIKDSAAKIAKKGWKPAYWMIDKDRAERKTLKKGRPIVLFVSISRYPDCISQFSTEFRSVYVNSTRYRRSCALRETL